MPPSLKVKTFVFVAMSIVISIAVMLTLEPYLILHWALAHPKSYTKHDPHHWLTRLALVSILLTTCRAYRRSSRPMRQKFQAWQQTFLPLPWERQEPHDKPGNS